MMFPQNLAEVAEDYRQQGYQVVVTPSRDQRPDFAAEIAIDLLAFKAQEKVIVEVHQSHADLRGDTETIRLSELVDAQEDWRLDLVVLNSEDPVESLLQRAEEPAVELQHEQLAMAEFFLRIDRLPIALVVAWTALEAGLRATARTNSLDLRSLTPDFLLETLCSHGIVSDEAYNELVTALELHSMVVRGLSYGAVKPETVRMVLRHAKDLLPEPKYEDRIAS